MNKIKINIISLFDQLNHALSKIPQDIYTKKINIYNGSTIGWHVRHIIEMLMCLIDGYDLWVVNYESRKRDKKIENEIVFAIQVANTYLLKIDKLDKELLLQSNEYNEVNSNYNRELIYIIEHTVHHMAIIRMWLFVIIPDMKLDDDFGVASSTTLYYKK